MAASITQTSFAAGEWAPALYSRSDLQKYSSAARLIENFICVPHGGVKNRPGTYYVGECKHSDKDVRLIPFEFSVTQAYVLEFGDSYMRVIKDGAYVMDGASPYEVATPWPESVLFQLDYEQSADTLYITHYSYNPRKITRTAHDNWTVTSVSFGPSTTTPTNVTRSAGSDTDHKYVVTCVIDELESAASSSVEAGGTDTISWDAVSGADYYKVYKDKDQNTGIYGWVQDVETTEWTDSDIDPDEDHTAPEANNPFSGAGDYPGKVAFHENRLVFARSNNEPQTFQGSRTGDFDNFNVSRPLRDDDSYDFTLNAMKMNEICWMVSMNDLIIGTKGSEWKVTSSGNTSSITPSSVDAKMQGSVGSTYNLKPLLVGNSILFVEFGAQKIHDFSYSLEIDGYSGSDLTVLANHLVDDRSIVDWSYHRSPWSVVWCVLDNGDMLGLTYLKEHQVWAWHRHNTGGDHGQFESVATVPKSSGEDQTYFVVKRYIDGSWVKYIEYLHEWLPEEDIRQAFYVDSGLTYDSPITISGATQANPVVITATSHGLSNGDKVYISDVTGMTEINDTWYEVASETTNTFELTNYDSGANIDGSDYTAYISGGEARKGVTTVSGLDHLEGETVTVLCDGSVVEHDDPVYSPSDMVVSSGQITLPHVVAFCHAGISYTQNLETMDFEFNPGDGTVSNKARRITSAVVRVHNTRAFTIGPDADNLTEPKWRRTEGYSDPTALCTTEKIVELKAGDDQKCRLYIRNDQPLPCHIHAVIPRISFGQY